MIIQKLSNIELYYTSHPLKGSSLIISEDEEFNHIVNVMRHKTGDELYVTNGRGSIYKTSIQRISTDSVETIVEAENKFENIKANIYFCIPRLKNTDRFETALEKCTELGITNFIVFDSARTIPKGDKTERWKKIVTSAMKQSLRSFLPVITTAKSLKEISVLKGTMLCFSQETDKIFTHDTIDRRSNHYLIFGPEGDFTDEEKSLFHKEDFYSLGDHRLRSETAIIKCASIIS